MAIETDGVNDEPAIFKDEENVVLPTNNSDELIDKHQVLSSNQTMSFLNRDTSTSHKTNSLGKNSSERAVEEEEEEDYMLELDDDNNEIIKRNEQHQINRSSMRAGASTLLSSVTDGARNLRQRLSLLVVGDGETVDTTSSLSNDTYSFLIFSKWNSKPALLAMMVFTFQSLLFILVMLDTINAKKEGNPFQIPVSVSPVVRTGQFFLVVLAVYMNNDIREVNTELLHGFTSTSISSAFCNSTSTFASREKWIFSIGLRLSQGILSLMTLWTRLLVESTVVELLFNFTALEFVSTIDNMTFFLSLEGYLGPILMESAQVVDQVTFSVKEKNVSLKSRWVVRSLSIIGWVCWAVVYYLQVNGYFMCQTIQVQFSDNYIMDLASFSGLYQLKLNGAFSRQSYTQKLSDSDNPYHGKATLGFCADESAWTLSLSGDHCKWIAKSSDIASDFSYDVLAVSTETWFTTNKGDVDVPLQHFQLECYDCEGAAKSIDCSDGGVCGNNQCTCTEGRYGPRCEYNSPCNTLNIDSRFQGFLGSRLWSKRYQMLLTNEDDENKKDKAVEIHGRPVYHNGDDVILFNGRRWALTTTNSLKITNLTSIMKEFHGYWSKPEYSFLTEAMDTDMPNDGPSPLGLGWFLVPFENQKNLHVTDLMEKSEAVMLCESCDSVTNPCAFQGVCMEDGKCSCTSGSLGVLCQIPPLGNGQCNQLFNTPEFNYDGGDCCQPTCISSEDYTCGTTVITPPKFGVYSSTQFSGYPNCTDPSQRCEPGQKKCMKTQISHSIPFPMKFDYLSKALYMHFFMKGRTVIVSGNGNVVAVGDPGLDQVQVYRINGNDWKPQGDALSGIQKSRFGYAVDLSDDGTTLAIGAPYNDNAKGAVIESFEWSNITGYVEVYFFDPILKLWFIKGQQLVSGASEGDLFGLSLSLSDNGSKLAIGSPNYNVNGVTSIGMARVYSFDSTQKLWINEGNDLVGGGSQAWQYFGYALSMTDDGQFLAVGAPQFGEIYDLGKSPFGQGRGFVRCFQFEIEKGEWTQLVPDVLPELDQTHRSFGFSVAIASNVVDNTVRIAVGDPHGGIEDEKPNEGVVRIYQLNLLDQNYFWKTIGQDLIGSRGWIESGASVALSNDGRVLAVGAADQFKVNSVAKCYDLETEKMKWEERSTKTKLPGYIVSLSKNGNIMVVGESGYESFPGKVRAYYNPSDVLQLPTRIPISIVLNMVTYSKDIRITLSCGNDVHLNTMSGDAFPNDKSFTPKNIETFEIPEGDECLLKFSALDMDNGGIQYEIYFGKDTTNSTNILAKGGQSFLMNEIVSFQATAPTTSVSSLVPMTLRLRLDYFAGDTYFDLECGSTYTFRSFKGGFSERYAKILATYYIKSNSKCTLTMYNAGGNGMCCTSSFGSYQIYYGDKTTVNISDTSNLIIYSDGIFGSNEIKTFIAASPNQNENSTLISPSALGIQEMHPFGFPNEDSLQPIITLVMKLDSYQNETGFSLQCSDSLDINFLPSTLPDTTYFVERFPMGKGTECQFRIHDTGGKGLCCNKGYVRMFNGPIPEREHIFVEILNFTTQATFNFTVYPNGAKLYSDEYLPQSICFDHATYVGSEIAGMYCTEGSGDSNDGVSTTETCQKQGGNFLPYLCSDGVENYLFQSAQNKRVQKKWWEPKCCVKEPSNPEIDTIITLVLKFDGKPQETWWSMDCGNGDTLYQFVSDQYEFTDQAYFKRSSTFIVPKDDSCHLVIYDSGNDGLCCQSWIGYYQVYLGRDITNTSNILAYGNGRFDNETEAIFTVSEKDTLSFLTAVTMHLKTDYLPHEIGFSIKCNDGTNIEYGPGTFSGLVNHDIVPTFFLQQGAVCQFTVVDTAGTGVCCEAGQGFARLYYGYEASSRDDNLFVEIIDFASQAVANFTVSSSAATTPPTHDFAPDSICSISRDLLIKDNLAGISCTMGGDSNMGTTEEECITKGGSWNKYTCKEAEDYWLFVDSGTKAFLRKWWEPKCCSTV